jgi:hypothetical protein
LDDTKRTGFKAGHTPDTQLGINQNNAIRPPGDGSFGASINTGGFSAVEAPHGDKIHLQFSPYHPGSNLDYIYPFDTHGQVVLLLAGYLTGKAPVA